MHLHIQTNYQALYSRVQPTRRHSPVFFTLRWLWAMAIQMLPVSFMLFCVSVFLFWLRATCNGKLLLLARTWHLSRWLTQIRHVKKGEEQTRSNVARHTVCTVHLHPHCTHSTPAPAPHTWAGEKSFYGVFFTMTSDLSDAAKYCVSQQFTKS